MTMYTFELKRHLKGLIIWSFSLLVIMLVASFEFDVYQGDEEIRAAMAAFEPFFAALGVENLDFTTAIGFLAIFSIYTYLPLSIYSGLLGLKILAKEEHKKTSEFLLTMPVKRTSIITAKLLAGLTLTLALNIILHGSIVLIFYHFDPTSTFLKFVFHMSLGVLFTQLIFMSIGFILGILVRREKVLNGVFLTILISTFMLSMLIGFLDNPYFLPYLTPFEYFRASAMIHGDFKLSYLLMSGLIIIISIVYSYYRYPRKNIML